MSSPHRGRAEFLAVLATGILHLILTTGLGLQAAFIGFAILGWSGYLAWRLRTDRTTLSLWGFRRENLAPAFGATSAVAVVGLVGMAILGWHRGQLALTWHLVPLICLYPVWGLVQQGLVQGLAASYLSSMPGWRGSGLVVVPICGLLFGIVHLPSVELTLGTSLLGLPFTAIYLRYRNLWPLGLYHGWLGAFFYLWVLGRDPWTEVLSSL